MNKYSKRLKGLNQLRIADKVLLKKQLKDKLIKEIEGFRTSPSQYKELINVDPKIVENVVKKIKKALNLS